MWNILSGVEQNVKKHQADRQISNQNLINYINLRNMSKGADSPIWYVSKYFPKD